MTKTKKPKPLADALVCVLVANVAEPATMSRVDTCIDCKRAVWRSLSSPQHLPAICGDCILRRQQFGEEPSFLPPTARQKRDIERTRKLK